MQWSSVSCASRLRNLVLIRLRVLKPRSQAAVVRGITKAMRASARMPGSMTWVDECTWMNSARSAAMVGLTTLRATDAGAAGGAAPAALAAPAAGGASLLACPAGFGLLLGNRGLLSTVPGHQVLGDLEEQPTSQVPLARQLSPVKQSGALLNLNSGSGASLSSGSSSGSGCGPSFLDNHNLVVCFCLRQHGSLVNQPIAKQFVLVGKPFPLECHVLHPFADSCFLSRSVRFRAFAFPFVFRRCNRFSLFISRLLAPIRLKEFVNCLARHGSCIKQQIGTGQFTV